MTPTKERADYTELDASILEQIGNGHDTFVKLRAVLEPMAVKFVSAPGPSPQAGHVPPWRAIDRRLQAMRKKGLLSFDRVSGRWCCHHHG